MKKTILLATAFITLTSSALGQYIRINNKESKNGLYFNYDRLWNYNQYEKSRWGLGLRYDIGFGDKSRLECLSLEGYGAYGYEDRRFKGGAQADIVWRTRMRPRLYVGYFHDLVEAAQVRLAKQSLTDLSALNGFMVRRFDMADRIYGGLTWRPARRLTLGLEGRFSRERRLYDDYVLYYPTSSQEMREMPTHTYYEARATLMHTSGLQAEMLLGHAHASFYGTEFEFPFYARFLMQYERSVKFSLFTCRMLALGGITTDYLPYSRHFDLGGHSGSPLLLSRSLVTSTPHEFTANLFAMASAKVGFTKPLFSINLDVWQVDMRPRPFVQAGAGWGRLWKQDEAGERWHDDMAMTAPSKGIAEVGAGIEGLIRWGVTDWGVAIFYRLTPDSAPYHLPSSDHNTTIIFTASLTI